MGFDEDLPSGKRLHSELEIHHAISGKTHELSMIMFDSYVNTPDVFLIYIYIYIYMNDGDAKVILLVLFMLN